MKYFRPILIVTRIIVVLLFAANVAFMLQLYNSIKERYISDVEQSLSRADQIEMVDRITDAGLDKDDGVVWLQIGLHKSDTVTTTSSRDMDKNYSQGFRRADKQILSIIAKYLHDNYSDIPATPDMRRMEEAFRRDMNYSGYYPEYVHIVGPEECFEYPSDLWQIPYRVDDELIYSAYISPLTKNILTEMSGVIVTSAFIALVLTFGFWYLLHVIKKLRTIEEMKDDFTNNMTHELKTPIAIAYAANDALLHFPEPENVQRTEKYLTAAMEQLSALAEAVESILAMSMERRKLIVMAKEKIHLHPFLTTIVEQQKIKATKPCDITLYCADDATVSADATHFANVMGNLIDNSIKYSAQSVSIIIYADSKRVTVTDNGIGISRKYLPHIFKKFYRVPHGNTGDVRGHGIGLYYVKYIVEKHGWQIDVHSSPGKGSTFTIHFAQQ